MASLSTVYVLAILIASAAGMGSAFAARAMTSSGPAPEQAPLSAQVPEPEQVPEQEPQEPSQDTTAPIEPPSSTEQSEPPAAEAPSPPPDQ